jgi:putative FmdB family regulatory protein
MPIYEFRCLSCDHVFELFSLGQGDTVEMKCPKCKGTEVERVLSAVGYIMGGESGTKSGAKVTTRSCSGGSCGSLEIPGPKR